MEPRFFSPLAVTCGLWLALVVACHSKSAPTPHAFAMTASSPAVTVPAWAIDPANSTGCASDANNCQSTTCGAAGIGPCSSYASIASRWGTTTPTLPQQTSITFLSDQVAGVDPVVVRPTMANVGQWLTINGTLLQQTTTTIGSFTARNRSAGTANRITASGQSGAYWAPFVGMFVTDTTASAYFWVEKDLGSATAQITEPVATTLGSQFPVASSYVTIANNDALVISRPTKVNCAQIGGQALPSMTVLQHVLCTGLGATISYSQMGVTGIAESSFDANETFESCSTSSPLIRQYIANSYFASGPGSTYASIQSAGAIVGTFPLLGCNPNENRALFDSDILIDPGTSFHAASGSVFGRAYWGSGTLLDTDGSGVWYIGEYDTGGGFFSDAEIWGPGHLDVHDHASIVCNPSGGCTAAILLTGGITMGNGATSQARPWNASGGNWGANASISGAAIDDAGAMCNPISDDCYRRKQ